MCLELGDCLFDRIEVGGVWGQIAQRCPLCFDRLVDASNLVAQEIVHDNDIAGLQRRREDLLDIGEEAIAVDRTIEDGRGGDAIPPQSGDEGRRFPVPPRNFCEQTLTADFF